MKTKTLAILTGALLVVASTALAGDNSDKKDSKSSTAAKNKDKKAQTAKEYGATETYKGVKVTGSNVKQNIRKFGMITDNSSQLLVIDQTMIERSGATDLRQLLGKTGVH